MYNEQPRLSGLAGKPGSSSGRGLWAEVKEINGMNKETPMRLDSCNHDPGIGANMANKWCNKDNDKNDYDRNNNNNNNNNNYTTTNDNDDDDNNDNNNDDNNDNSNDNKNLSSDSAQSEELHNAYNRWNGF